MQPSETDEALLRKAHAGDARAIEALLTKHENSVYRFGLRMCGNEADARDVLQETLLAAFRNLASFRGDSKLSTWLYQIARSFCLKQRRLREGEPAKFASLDDGPARHVAEDMTGTDTRTHARQVSEVIQAAIGTLPEDHREALVSDDPKVRVRLTSLGKPLPTVEIEIRNEEGKPVGHGEPGEIYVRGEQVSGEYQEKSALDAKGWFPTRDAGYMDEEGYLFLSGRADDVIVRGGENMSPSEIEDVLLTNPAIADACACAIPSVEWGEAVGVVVVVREGHVRPNEAELKELIRARLRSSRVPEKVQFAKELPYNEMGKLLRREVKKILAE